MAVLLFCGWGCLTGKLLHLCAYYSVGQVSPCLPRRRHSFSGGDCPHAPWNAVLHTHRRVRPRRCYAHRKRLHLSRSRFAAALGCGLGSMLPAGTLPDTPPLPPEQNAQHCLSNICRRFVLFGCNHNLATACGMFPLYHILPRHISGFWLYFASYSLAAGPPAERATSCLMASLIYILFACGCGERERRCGTAFLAWRWPRGTPLSAFGFSSSHSS